MTQFDDREQAFENQFGHDEETQFKIASRAAHLFGLWAANELGLKGAEAEAYAQQAIDIEVAKSGRADLIAKTEKDFAAKQLSFSQHRLQKEMEACYVQARGQFAGTAKRA
jgi:hypothetical protein